jgi:hypothetical protein
VAEYTTLTFIKSCEHEIGECTKCKFVDICCATCKEIVEDCTCPGHDDQFNWSAMARREELVLSHECPRHGMSLEVRDAKSASSE